MRKALLYIHGKGGSSKETEQLKPFCDGYDIHGIDLSDFTPWGTEEQIQTAFERLKKEYDCVSIVGNSIGAYFSMFALQNSSVEKAFFISPILDMERLILDMMMWANVTEKELQEQGTIQTEFGETLSWEYLSFVRDHPIHWKTPTVILYAEHDNMTSQKIVDSFVSTHQAKLTVMPKGEHWFHTSEQLAFLGEWLKGVC
ncbi:alpha/beta hydrolase [Clostridiaceae bacterium]|nr:alpha/beta hydrolase [Clostridiaceae bacterium]RKI13400.1 alpha/beta hydrolase [bacterium 1XD21-70]